MLQAINTCGIYAIRKDERVAYIGHSSNIPRRWREHKSDLRKGNHDNPHLQNSWNDHGPDAFEFIVLEECSEELLVEREQFHMDQYPDSFNVYPAAGSPLGYKHTSEARINMSAAARVRAARKRAEEAYNGWRPQRLTDDQSREHMGNFSDAAKQYNVDTRGDGRCVTGRWASENLEDDDDLEEFTRLASAHKWGLILRLSEHKLRQKSLFQHVHGVCPCLDGQAAKGCCTSCDKQGA